MSEYTAWLKNQSAHRVMLVEIDGYNTSTHKTETLYLSTESTLDYQHYHSRISKTPIVIRSFDRHQAEGGVIELNNADGALDPLMYHNFGGREIRIYHGDISWPFSSGKFRNVFTGKIVSFEIVNDNTFQVEFSAGNNNLDAPLSDYTFEFGDQAGKVMPVCIGYCKNVTPITTSAASWVYQVHHDAVEDTCVQLYVDGKVSNLNVNKNNFEGEFWLDQDPQGVVTCDVKGASAVAEGVRYKKGGEILKYLLTMYGHLDAANIRQDLLDAYDESAPEIALYFEDGSVNLIDAINKVLDSHLAFFSFSREGMFGVVRPMDMVTGEAEFTGQWTSIDKVDRDMNSGQIGIDQVGVDWFVHISKFDSVGGDQTIELDKLEKNSEIYIEQDTGRWHNFRVDSVSVVGNEYQFSVIEIESGNKVRKNKNVSVRLTTFTNDSSVRQTSIFIDDTNLVGDIRMSHDNKRPRWKTTVGYDKNWTVQDGTNTAFKKNEYRYVSRPVAPDEAGHKAVYADSISGFPDLTNIVNQVDAETEADLIQTAREIQRYFIAPVTVLTGFDAELGQIAEISSERFGLSDKRFLVLEIEEDIMNGTSKVKGWF